MFNSYGYVKLTEGNYQCWGLFKKEVHLSPERLFFADDAGQMTTESRVWTMISSTSQQE